MRAWNGHEITLALAGQSWWTQKYCGCVIRRSISTRIWHEAHGFIMTCPGFNLCPQGGPVPEKGVWTIWRSCAFTIRIHPLVTVPIWLHPRCSVATATTCTWPWERTGLLSWNLWASLNYIELQQTPRAETMRKQSWVRETPCLRSVSNCVMCGRRRCSWGMWTVGIWWCRMVVEMTQSFCWNGAECLMNGVAERSLLLADR
jgi:hypothetical protein